MLGWITLGLNAVVGAARGTGNVISGKRQAAANRAEANYNLDQLGLKSDYLEQNYNDNQEKLLADLDAALDEGTQGIWSTTVAQRNNMSLAATTNTENQSIAYAQLASLQRENSRTVGSTVSAVAGSGFRNTGSGANAIAEAERDAERSYELQRRSIQLSAYQGYMQAANDYFSANVQIEGYRESMRNAQSSYDLEKKMLDSQYAYENEVLQGEIGYWEGVRDNSDYTWGDFFGDFFGGFSF